MKRDPRPYPNKEGLALAHRYINAIRNRDKERYAWAYLGWLKGGAMGREPEHGRLSVMGAQAVRLQLAEFPIFTFPKIDLS